MPFLGNEPSNTFVSITKQSITGNGGTVYALAQAVTNAADLDVYVNNIRQEPYVAYNASGTTITFTDAIASTDSVYWLFNGQTIGTLSVPSNSVGVGQLNTTEVDARYVNATGDTINGTLTVKDSTGTDTYLNVSSAGRVTMPYQPTFCGYANTTSGYSDSPLKYDATIVNVGSHYNTSTYRFTAPVSGNYFFSFSIWTGSASTTRCGFYKNGSPVGNSSYPIGTRNQAGAQDNDSASVIIPLSVNDYVDIRCYEGAVAIFSTNYFLGRLIG